MTLQTMETDLSRWVRILQPAMMLAERICDTEFVPKAMRGKPEPACAAIMYGDEISIGPMQALANIDVVEGRPRLSAALMRAMVKAAGHDIEIMALDGKKCRARARRRGQAPGIPIEWTIDMAKSAGLTSKVNWRNYPRAMLLARATAEVATIDFPDVVRGLDVGDDDSTAASFQPWAESIAPSPHDEAVPSGATIKRQAIPRQPAWAETANLPAGVVEDTPLPEDDTPQAQEGPQEAPEWPQEGPADVDGADDLGPAPVQPWGPPVDKPPPLPPERKSDVPDVPIGQALLRAVLAGFDRISCTDRSLRLEISRAIIHRPIGTSKELTRREGLKIVRVLSELETGSLELVISPEGAVSLVSPETGEME